MPSTTSRDPDRLLLFTDAVVAIAITLLVLPLVDLVSEHVPRPSAVITENWTQILNFTLSFVLIARLWLTHHRTFQHVHAYNRALILWNMAWLFTAVVLPFSTELIGVYSGTFVACFYIGTILVSSMCQTVMIVLIHRTPEIQRPDNPLTTRNVVSAVTATGLLAVAFLLALLFPDVNYYGLLVLLPAPFVVRLWDRFAASGS